jgi:DNA recombination protein RmuC
MQIDVLSLGLGTGAGLLVGASVVGLIMALRFMPRLATLETEKREQDQAHQNAIAAMEQQFKVYAQDALDRNADHFLKLAQEKLKQSQSDNTHELDKRKNAIQDLITPVQKQLEVLGSAVEQIKGTDQALRADLKDLSKETARLAGALRDPSAQGRWGEFILEGLLERAGLMRGVHFDTQFTMQGQDGQKQRPDAIIRLQDGLSMVVDAKAPLNEFVLQAQEQMTQEEFDQLTMNVAKQVRKHVGELGRKNYWDAAEIQSPDFTVLFLPSEHLFSMALRADPQLVDHALHQNVILASPTSFMALLRVVALGWRQGNVMRNAQDIAEQASELYKRVATFVEHFDKVGRSIGQAMASYNKAVGSLERQIMPSARRFKELNVNTVGKEIGEIATLSEDIRGFTVPEFTKVIAPEPEAVSAIEFIDEKLEKRTQTS